MTTILIIAGIVIVAFVGVKIFGGVKPTTVPSKPVQGGGGSSTTDTGTDNKVS